MRSHKTYGYAAFRTKIMKRFCINGAISVFSVIFLYLFVLKQRFGDWMVYFLDSVMGIRHEQAFYIYHIYFRNHKEIFFAVGIIIVFVFSCWNLFHWITGYFDEIDRGIDTLLEDDVEQVSLCEEMLPFERKLNTVKRELEERRRERADAERRKDELVMYLAHDIRTPLTSVIGYLNLLREDRGMPAERKERCLQVAIEKADRMKNMVNEFFEITRLNAGQIRLSKRWIDLYYMLVQLCDELSPSLEARGNTVALELREELAIFADSDKMARVFANIMKNAAAYSYPKTEIKISAEETDQGVAVSFCNKGREIPPEKLPLLFRKFYRIESSRVSDMGGTGLGLAIAREIVCLHGGRIDASCGEETVTFTVWLPSEGESRE